MPVQYSASISGFCRQTDVFSSLSEIKQAGYDGVDFPLYIYTQIKNIALRNDSWWRIWTQTVRDFTDSLGLTVLQAHAPWKENIPVDFRYEAPSQIHARVFAACNILGCKKLVFHPVVYPYRIVSAKTEQAIHDYNLRWFRDLLPFTETYGVTIELENTFDYFHLQMPGDPLRPYTTAAQLNALADDLHSPFVKICLDTGHANIASQNIPQMIAMLGDRLDCLHLNDNFGKQSGQNEDLHLFPGEGTISWKETAAALKRIGYRGNINLEIIADLSQLPPSKRTERLRQGRADIQSVFATA